MATNRKQKWDDKRREQFGHVNHLILTFAIAAMAFLCDKLKDKEFQPNLGAKIAFDLALIFLLLSAGLGIWCSHNRLRDLRQTAWIAGYNADDVHGLELLREKTDKIGNWTWSLLRWQICMFFLGLAASAAAFLCLYHEKLL